MQRKRGRPFPYFLLFPRTCNRWFIHLCVSVCSLCQMFETGQTKWEILDGKGFIFRSLLLTKFQKRLNCILERASDKSLDFIGMNLAKTLLLWMRLFKVMRCRRYIQFLYEEVMLLIMATTAWLLQKITILQFSNMNPHVSIVAVTPKSPKYLMEGLYFSMNLLSHLQTTSNY